MEELAPVGQCHIRMKSSDVPLNYGQPAKARQPSVLQQFSNKEKHPYKPNRSIRRGSLS
jgi:hypothetical protein